MMKVICTNHDDLPGIASLPWEPDDPQIGEEYEVEDERTGLDHRGREFEAYKIKGFDRFVYSCHNFSTLNGPDEQDLHEQHVEKLTAEFVAKYGEPPIVELNPVALARIWGNIKGELDKTDWA